MTSLLNTDTEKISFFYSYRAFSPFGIRENGIVKSVLTKALLIYAKLFIIQPY